jgi:SAM-dependent methyltransferase
MFPFASLEPKYVDHRKQSGAVDGHYFAQDLYVAQQLFMNSPKRHLDIGSRIDGFVSHVASFREIVVGDIRPATIKAKNIQFIRVDITDKSGIPNSSFDSVSCLHVLEHVGLGRYGDRIHPDGWLAAISNLVDIVTPGGRIYISVPVGRQKVAFNAHRIFDFSTIFEALSQLVLVDRLALVDDYQELHEFASNSAPAKDMADLQSYGCLVLSGTKHVKSKS